MSSSPIIDGLELIIDASSKMKLHRTESVAESFLKKYQKGIRNSQLLTNLENTLISEFSQKDYSYGESCDILREIISRAFQKRMKSGKFIKFGKSGYNSLKDLEYSLGVITEEIQHTKSTKDAMLLACLGHVIRYEVLGKSVKNDLLDLINIGYPNLSKQRRNQKVEDYFRIRLAGDDKKADTTHLRHSIAHGRFKFLNDKEIVFTNVNEKGQEIFKIVLNSGDILNLFNMFEMKLRFVYLYFNFIILAKLFSGELKK